MELGLTIQEMRLKRPKVTAILTNLGNIGRDNLTLECELLDDFNVIVAHLP